jgi:hypothetical protein
MERPGSLVTLPGVRETTLETDAVKTRLAVTVGALWGASRWALRPG